MSVPFPTTTVIDANRDWAFTVFWQDSTGAAYNLTGYTATFTLREDYNKPVVYTLAVGSGVTITAATGQITLNATHTQNAISPGTYVGELIATSGGGVQTSLVKGQIVVKAYVVA